MRITRKDAGVTAELVETLVGRTKNNSENDIGRSIVWEWEGDRLGLGWDFEGKGGVLLASPWVVFIMAIKKKLKNANHGGVPEMDCRRKGISRHLFGGTAEKEACQVGMADAW